ncbi:actin-histidine N-methyltransferase-like [Macrosteles quadrilineatus]|uniref:actin-histidine N-methyltransferase-like n=1 Tax=Macrosteles quadrilineatus TaxID=74068 RepID=UPI0023E14CAF|nr:actin-histidine N-methyltransferase-like [Macrosteles quadrilineatus]
MGKKHQNKLSSKVSVHNPVKEIQGQDKKKINFKLSPQKRNEVNQLVDKLLKVSTTVQPTTATNIAKDLEVHLEIEKILNKINTIESELKLPLPNRTVQNQEGLLTWLENHDAEVQGVGITEFPGHGLGLVALRDVSEGEVIVAVPRKLMITAESVQASKLGYLLANETMLKHMPNVALALFLLLERFSSEGPSFWAPYLNMLPSAYTTVLYFTAQELQELKGSPTLEGALKQCRNIARQYAYFYRLFQNMSDPASEILREVFTYEQYRWAVSTVMTRQNFIPSADGSSMVNALIPLWDMANHSNGKISTDYSLGSDRSECLAWRDFNAGEQVFIFYGARSNADLLVHNGFVYPDNIHDSFRIRLGVAKSDPLSAQRAKVLGRLGLPTAADFVLLRGAQPVEGQLLAFLRVFSMNQEHLDQWVDSERVLDLTYPDCALDTQVEAKAWNFLLARIKLLQSLYPTTLEDDLKILEEKMTECRKLSIQLRIAEKKILQSAMEYIQQRDKP